MIYFLGVVFFLLAFLLMAIILLQEGKGGGLAAMGGAMTDSVMGARNPLRRLTAYFFIAFVVISIGINVMISNEAKAEMGAGLAKPTPESTGAGMGGAGEKPAEKDAAAPEKADTPVEAAPEKPAAAPEAAKPATEEASDASEAAPADTSKTE